MEIPKNKWMDVPTDEYGGDLVRIVQTAYKKAPMGSFINTKSDLVGSDWHSIDIDSDPDIDATIFYRKARGGESWSGYKIQGIGHDGSRKAIDKVLKKLKSQLGKRGWWIEASDAIEHIMYKLGVRYIEDEVEAQKVFPNTDLKMTGNRGQYTRKAGSKTVRETIFGYPKI